MSAVKDRPDEAARTLVGRVRPRTAAHAGQRVLGSGKRILLIDDLYRSGATATLVAQALLAGGAATVHMLAMTKTRTRT